VVGAWGADVNRVTWYTFYTWLPPFSQLNAIVIYRSRAGMKTSRISSDETLKFYRASPTRTIAQILPASSVVIIWVCLSGGLLFADYNRAGAITTGVWIAFAIFVLLILFTMASIWSKATQTYLLLLPDGIEYKSGWHMMATPWDNIEELRGTQLILKQSVLSDWQLFWSRDPKAGKIIPLWEFNYELRSELARDIRYYAPHLFTSEQ
jgi:hypothetical protein